MDHPQPKFTAACAFMEEARKGGGKTLVHCVSASPRAHVDAHLAEGQTLIARRRITQCYHRHCLSDDLCRHEPDGCLSDDTRKTVKWYDWTAKLDFHLAKTHTLNLAYSSDPAVVTLLA